jgi:hypothetical protein
MVDGFMQEGFIEKFFMYSKGAWFVRLPYFYQTRKFVHREWPLGTGYVKEFERKCPL